MGGKKGTGDPPFLGRGGPIYRQSQQRRQAKGFLKWQWLPVSRCRTEELGTNQNALECVGDRQATYDRSSWPCWPGAPAASYRFCGSRG